VLNETKRRSARRNVRYIDGDASKPSARVHRQGREMTARSDGEQGESEFGRKLARAVLLCLATRAIPLRRGFRRAEGRLRSARISGLVDWWIGGLVD
jgi:hypothetical protein